MPDRWFKPCLWNSSSGASLTKAVKSSFFGAPPVKNGAYSRPSQPPTNRLYGGGPGRVVPGTAM